jgi:hypothetical protein
MGNMSRAYWEHARKLQVLQVPISLSTGKKVTRRKFTEMPMTDSVIKMVDSLGKKEKGTMQKWVVLQKQERRRIHIQQ